MQAAAGCSRVGKVPVCNCSPPDSLHPAHHHLHPTALSLPRPPYQGSGSCSHKPGRLRVAAKPGQQGAAAAGAGLVQVVLAGANQAAQGPAVPVAVLPQQGQRLFNSARIFTRIEASGCRCAEPHAELVGHFAGGFGLETTAEAQQCQQHQGRGGPLSNWLQEIGILVACAYFKNKEGAYKEQTVYVMTDGKEQSAAITQAAVNQVVHYLLAEHDMDMMQLYMWSDGCAGQFKGAPAMRQHWGMAQRFNVPVWWRYGATSHLKGRHGSEEGVVKQWLRGEILADRAKMCNASEFVQHCNAHHKPATAADPSKAHRARASVGHRWCLELSTQKGFRLSGHRLHVHVPNA
ncbi:hypothetical protein HaLaN_03209 [Haematococcus lacustris]|uniref:Uncharacterized protein n=1 Tax=Haematococcus lacustris TaxID=44745 RepID=A0A699YNA0_HAELA|nr:hypothetical protein HaLaN_03209 [Haematococcus lacustris]